jgi:hypothetical protein
MTAGATTASPSLMLSTSSAAPAVQHLGPALLPCLAPAHLVAAALQLALEQLLRLQRALLQAVHLLLEVADDACRRGRGRVHAVYQSVHGVYQRYIVGLRGAADVGLHGAADACKVEQGRGQGCGGSRWG